MQKKSHPEVAFHITIGKLKLVTYRHTDLSTPMISMAPISLIVLKSSTRPRTLSA